MTHKSLYIFKEQTFAAIILSLSLSLLKLTLLFVYYKSVAQIYIKLIKTVSTGLTYDKEDLLKNGDWEGVFLTYNYEGVH